MKKGIILNFKKLRLLNYVTLNKTFLALCVLFLTGIVLGSTLLLNNDFLIDKIGLLFDNFLKVHTENVFFEKLFIVFAKYSIVLILYFLSGASILGVAVTPFLTVWFGMVIGGFISHIYSQYGFIGIAFNAIVLIPPLVVFVVCCFFAAKNAIDFSLSIAKLTLPKSRPGSLFYDFKNYCFKYLYFLITAFFCALIEITLNILFLKYFNF